MSLDVGYSYCTNLTEQEKLAIDEQVHKNRIELKMAVLLILGTGPMVQPIFPLFPFPVEGFKRIVRGPRERVESVLGLAKGINDFAEVEK